jgi:hypothetical protein
LVRALACALLATALWAVHVAPSEAARSWSTPTALTTLNSHEPDVVVNADGEATATWLRSGGLVQVATRAPGDDFWGSTVTLSAKGAYEAPSLAVNASGEAVAVWIQQVGSDYRLEAAFRDGAGAGWSTPVLLSPAGSRVEAPRVLIDDAGVATAAWSLHQSVTQAEIEVATRPAGGEWGAPVELASGNLGPPRIAANPAGDMSLVWIRDQGPFEPRLIEFSSRPAGGTWSEPATISNPGVDSIAPNSIVTADGEIVAVWRNALGVETRLVSASLPPGGSWSEPEDISAIEREISGAELAIDGAGEVVATWIRDEEAGNNFLVETASRAPDGSWGAAVKLGVSGSPAHEVNLSVNSAGAALATWEEKLNAHPAAVKVMAAYRPAGGAWQSPVTIIAKGFAVRLPSPQPAVYPNGDAVAVWQSTEEPNNVLTADLRPAPIAAPTLLSTNPASPADDNNPELIGTADANTSVRIFTNSTCTGAPVAEGSGEGFATGLTVHVKNNSTNQFYAAADDGEGEVSACVGPLYYSESSGPIGLGAALATLPVSDRFAASESPISAGGIWRTLAWALNPGATTGGHWVSADPYYYIDGTFWARSTFADPGTGLAASARLWSAPGLPGRSFSVWLDMPAPGSEESGYELRFTETGPNKYKVALARWEAGARTVIAALAGYVLSPGGSIAIVDQGGVVSAWGDTGGGYAEIISASDSAFDGGYAGISAVGKGARISVLRAGLLPILSP